MPVGSQEYAMCKNRLALIRVQRRVASFTRIQGLHRSMSSLQTQNWAQDGHFRKSKTKDLHQ